MKAPSWFRHQLSWRLHQHRWSIREVFSSLEGIKIMQDPLASSFFKCRATWCILTFELYQGKLSSSRRSISWSRDNQILRDQCLHLPTELAVSLVQTFALMMIRGQGGTQNKSFFYSTIKEQKVKTHSQMIDRHGRQTSIDLHQSSVFVSSRGEADHLYSIFG